MLFELNIMMIFILDAKLYNRHVNAIMKKPSSNRQKLAEILKKTLFCGRILTVNCRIVKVSETYGYRKISKTTKLHTGNR